MAQHSLLKGKPLFCREWAFAKFFHCLETRATSKTCGLLITGGPGSGKTALCCEMVWPTVGSGNSASEFLPFTIAVVTINCFLIYQTRMPFLFFPVGKQHTLSKHILAYHFCEAHDIDTLSPTRFIHSLVEQISESNLVKEYKEKLNDPEIANSLEVSACEQNPDEAFKRAVLFPLLDVEAPKHACLLLVDSIDESYLLQVTNERSSEGTWDYFFMVLIKAAVHTLCGRVILLFFFMFFYEFISLQPSFGFQVITQ